MFVTNRFKGCIIITGDLPRSQVDHPRQFCLRPQTAAPRIFDDTHPMRRKVFISSRFISILAVVTSLAITTLAQGESLQREREFASQSGGQMWYTMMGLLAVIGFAFAGWFWWRSKKGADKVDYNYKNRYANYHGGQPAASAPVDAEKELEWLRRARTSLQRKRKRRSAIPDGPRRTRSRAPRQRPFRRRCASCSTRSFR